MRPDSKTSDDEQTNEPEWVLASYGHRVGAWALDFVLSIITKTVMFVLAMSFILKVVLSGVDSVFDIPDWSARTGAIVAVLIGVAIGYIVWWLIALGRGQTPGKQILGIRVIKDDGEPSEWGYTFLREFVVKFLLLGFLSQVTFGIAWLVDYLWPLWDRADKMQTLHDKMLGTLVVRSR
ncbi:MAG: RDD family protein [Chloroflexi bacterium]|nr:RDD family protein [Chloroflexota bacterium]